MSMMKRISMVFRAKANSALDKAEDPRETLDYSYQRQLEMLTKVRRGVADVALASFEQSPGAAGETLAVVGRCAWGLRECLVATPLDQRVGGGVRAGRRRGAGGAGQLHHEEGTAR